MYHRKISKDKVVSKDKAHTHTHKYQAYLHKQKSHYNFRKL